MKNLLEKYRRSDISPDELETLGRKIEEASDDEIGKILEGAWMRDGSCEYAPEMVYAGRGRDGVKGTHKSGKIWLWTSVAAGLLLLATVGLSLRLASVRGGQNMLADKEMRIDTGENGKSKIILPDGTKVTLNTRSTIEYPSDFGMKNRRVKLSGQGYFDVTNDAGHEFIVSSEGMDIIVHGTKFNVYAYPDNDLREVSLIEGSVSLRYGDAEVMLAPNEKVCIRAGSGRLNMLRTDNSIETCWLEDRITFINKPLYQVIDILQRHYGVTIECDSEINLADRYTGTFNERSAEDVLDILKMHYGFSYESRDNRIIISNPKNN